MDETLPLEELSPQEEALVAALLLRLPLSTPSTAELSDATVASLEQLCPEVGVSAALSRKLDGLGRAAEADLAYERSLTGTRRPSLGGYLAFLRNRAGLAVREAAAKARIPFQTLADLERDGLRPAEVVPGQLVRVLRSLGASLPLTERLLPGLVRAPRLIPAPVAGRLYRAERGGGASAAASRRARGQAEEWVENPEYAEQLEAVGELGEAVRSGW